MPNTLNNPRLPSPASPPGPAERDALASLRRVRQATNEFFRWRALNEAALRGGDPKCPLTPTALRQQLRIFRDPAMEGNFARGWDDLLTLIYRREPTDEELRVGVPEEAGLAGLPAFGETAAAIAGAAWGLVSVTNYLTERERLARGAGEATPPRPDRLLLLGKSLLVVGGVVGGGYGAYRLFRWAKQRWFEQLPPQEQLEELADEREDLEDELEETEAELEELEEQVVETAAAVAQEATTASRASGEK